MKTYAELDVLRNKLASLRPIDPDKLAAVREKFRLEWTYNSNALEGNPLTLSETSFFVREGLTSRGKPLAAYLEAKNHMEALDYLDAVVRDRDQITEHVMKQYHSMLFSKIDFMEIGSGKEIERIRIEPGQYKKQNNHVIRIDGKILPFTDWLQVPGEIERLFADFENQKGNLHPIELAGRFHHMLVSIHPFIDGNGRVARLLMNTILMQGGYTPAIVPVEEKRRYLEALQSADDGSYDSLFGYLEELVNRTLRLTVDVIEGREAFDLPDLARMFRNFAQGAKGLEQELGGATLSPEVRASQTSLKLGSFVNQLLQEHAQSASTAEGKLNFVPNTGVRSTSIFQRALSTIQSAQHSNCSQLNFAPGKRFIPSFTVNFIPIWGRYQAGLFGGAFVGRFSDQRVEVLTGEYEPFAKSVAGSIYFEDWDLEEVRRFVVDIIKETYKLCALEMGKRKTMIAQEESEVEKYRPRQT